MYLYFEVIQFTCDIILVLSGIEVSTYVCIMYNKVINTFLKIKYCNKVAVFSRLHTVIKLLTLIKICQNISVKYLYYYLHSC